MNDTEIVDLRIKIDLVMVGKLAVMVEKLGGEVIWCRIAAKEEEVVE